MYNHHQIKRIVANRDARYDSGTMGHSNYYEAYGMGAQTALKPTFHILRYHEIKSKIKELVVNTEHLDWFLKWYQDGFNAVTDSKGTKRDYTDTYKCAFVDYVGLFCDKQSEITGQLEYIEYLESTEIGDE